ncbi:MAG: hypothetical protein ABJA62_08410 [Luteimonas sp.]
MSKPIDYPYDDYTQDYELAKMAGASYHSRGEIEASMREKDEDKRLLPDGWKIRKFEDKNAETGFVAYVFRNDDKKKIVIAYRGSDNLIDFTGANLAIAQDGDLKLPGLPDWDRQFDQGLQFAQDVIHKYGKDYDISVTGHSLGGSLAQVASQMYGLPGRTFDPAGGLNLVQSDEFALKAKSLHFPAQGRGNGEAGLIGYDRDFLNYRVNDSLVSRHSGPQVGPTLDLTRFGGRDGSEQETALAIGLKRLPADASLLAVLDLPTSHNIDRIIGVFKQARDTGHLNQLGAITPEVGSPSHQLAGPALKPSSANNSLDDVITRMAEAARQKDSATFGAAVTAYAQSPLGQVLQQETQERYQQIKAHEQQLAWEAQQQMAQRLAQQQEQAQAHVQRGPVMRM